jgi:23S rRNA U2552 (ribose-2'-O)-methylase RlmE/FtsJ
MNNYQEIRHWNIGIWLTLGKSRMKVMELLLEKNHPITATEIQETIGISLPQFTYIKKQLLEKKFIKCINPKVHHGKRFIITQTGRSAMNLAHSMIYSKIGSGKTHLLNKIYNEINNQTNKNNENIEQKNEQLCKAQYPDALHLDKKNNHIISIEFKLSELNDTIQQMKTYVEELKKMKINVEIKKIKEGPNIISPFFQPKNAKKENFSIIEKSITVDQMQSFIIVIFHFMIFDTECRLIATIDKKSNKNDLKELIEQKDLHISKEVSELLAEKILQQIHN